MKWLYFTRSNGDVDCMPENTGLTTDKKKRDFIGDPGATNFKILANKKAVKNPSWDGQEYVDADPNKGARMAARNDRDAALAAVTVEINGVDVWASPANEQSIIGRIREMEASAKTECKWVQGASVFILTMDELKTVLVTGTSLCSAIFDNYITILESL